MPTPLFGEYVKFSAKSTWTLFCATKLYVCTVHAYNLVYIQLSLTKERRESYVFTKEGVGTHCFVVLHGEEPGYEAIVDTCGSLIVTHNNTIY